jgi:TRAP-type mannitol/chloroaromatic compound transport system substrate-binding protein
MAELVEFPLNGGGSILVALPDDEGGAGNIASRDTATARRVTKTLEASLELVKPAAEAIRQALRDLAPGEIEVKFGITFSVRSGFPILSAATEGTFEVTLHWVEKDVPSKPRTLSGGLGGPAGA